MSGSGAVPEDVQRRLRALPAVDQLAASLQASSPNGAPSVADAMAAARAVLTERRQELLDGATGDVDLQARANERLRPPLRRTLNGTGVVLHTNLGRSPLPDIAIESLTETASSYVNLELDLTSGRRSQRDTHISELLTELTGAEDAMVVNNCAAAVLLVCAALGGPERTIAVSRGQLVEIGGGFRIPEVVAQAGAHLVEVGTTNRTRLSDYEDALATGADLILRVHPSNFRTVGFVEDVNIKDLCGLGAPVIDDVGSGALADHLEILDDEPAVRASVRAGATAVCFSGDKLLGGPQAGIILGTSAAIATCRRHPLARALRIGRLPLTALVATLALYRDPALAVRDIPTLAMLTMPEPTLRARAEQLAAGTGGQVIETVAQVGGGALPMLELKGPAVALEFGIEPGRLAARLRSGDPALLTRIANGQVIVDPRTLRDDELESVPGLVLQARAELQALESLPA